MGVGSCLLPVVGTVAIQDESHVHDMTPRADSGAALAPRTLGLKTQAL